MAARCALVCVLALLAAPSPASAGWSGDAARARSGLDRAVADGRLAALDAERYREDLAQAVATLPRLPPARAANLAAVVRDVAAQAPRYQPARALALFSMLRVNADHLARSPMPARGNDVRDADGVAYRSFPGRGLQFHPLASFGRLNRELTAGRYRRAMRLAFALLARAELRGGALVWEYYFRFAGGTPPWTSGMAQAVAAQALARAGLPEEARLAYRAVPGRLAFALRSGPWIRLYSFNDMAVLNAQLQAAVSLREYARLVGDGDAARLARGLRRSARALLPRFDTGFWSLYALGGREAPIRYHQYVVSLLWKLSTRTGNPYWRAWAARFRDHWRKPPYVEPRGASPVVYPVPADGFKDAAEVRFWVSKPATVTITVGRSSYSLRVGPGPRRFLWWPARRRPGVYPVRITAVDRAGNRFERGVRPVVVRRDTTAPRVRAELQGSRLAWRASDAATPWLKLRLLLRRGGGSEVVDLGRFPLRGSTELELPPEMRHATLVVLDSSRNRTAVPLGTIGGQGRHPRGTTLRQPALP